MLFKLFLSPFISAAVMPFPLYICDGTATLGDILLMICRMPSAVDARIAAPFVT